MLTSWHTSLWSPLYLIMISDVNHLVIFLPQQIAVLHNVNVTLSMGQDSQLDQGLLWVCLYRQIYIYIYIYIYTGTSKNCQSFGNVGRWNQHLHKACQQKEVWSDQTFPGRWLRWLWTSKNTVAIEHVHLIKWPVSIYVYLYIYIKVKVTWGQVW